MGDAEAGRSYGIKAGPAAVCDTAGLAADAAGAFHPVWVDGRAGTNQVYTATVTMETEK